MKLSTLAFEARFKDGYRYLDHCGEFIVRLQSRDSNWLPNNVNPMAGHLRNENLNILLFLNVTGIALNLYKAPVDLHNAEALIERYAGEVEAIYDITIQSLKVTETTRVGARFRFLAQADTLEEADRFVCNGARSSLLTQIETSTSSRLRDAGMVYVVEDAETGYRRRVEIVSEISQKVGEAPLTGLDREERTGAVAIDVDTFTRPERGHFDRSNMFIQRSFLRSRTISLEIFEWLRQLQPAVHRR